MPKAGFEMKVAKGVDKSMHDGGRNNHVKPNMRKNRNGKGKLKKTPIRETKVSEFFGNDWGVLLHTQRVTRKEVAK